LRRTYQGPKHRVTHFYILYLKKPLSKKITKKNQHVDSKKPPRPITLAQLDLWFSSKINESSRWWRIRRSNRERNERKERNWLKENYEQCVLLWMYWKFCSKQQTFYYHNQHSLMIKLVISFFFFLKWHLNYLAKNKIK